jgi:hypothetical protein
MSEFSGLPKTLIKLRPMLPEAVMNPIKVDLQPGSPVAQTAKRCAGRIRLLEGRVDAVVVLIDREERQECPGHLAASLAGQLAGAVFCPVAVVIKNRTLENWLVADFDAMSGLQGRFSFTAADRNGVVPNRADGADALKMLKRASGKREYDKVPDAQRILGAADPIRMAANSRSFRKFLRSVRHPTYQGQSQNPL